MSTPSHRKFYFDAMRDSSTGLQLPPSSDWRVRITTTSYLEFNGYTLLAKPMPEHFIQFEETNSANTTTEAAIGGDAVTDGDIPL